MPTNLDQFSLRQVRKQINEFEDRRQLTPLKERRKSTVCIYTLINKSINY